MTHHDQQAQQEEELRFDFTQALKHAQELGLSEQDLRLLCWGVGMSYEKEIRSETKDR